MIPLADLHIHLLAGLDDGPKTDADAVAMCRIAFQEGVRLVAATAHQNETHPAVTPERIRTATLKLNDDLHAAGIELTVFPCAEVMVRPEIEDAWQADRLLSVADRRQYLLVEMPRHLSIDFRKTAKRLCRAGIRPILAHPERHAELLHGGPAIDELIRAGCLVQVSSGSVTDPASREDARALRSWFRRGVVHLLGSDGHSPGRRPPLMAGAYRQIAHWAGVATADRIGSTNGLAVLGGLPLRISAPQPLKQSWFALFW